ncbi:hypothetical protein GO495_26720 [Chitinophaga oryziterrae]|uniref:Uncharacterized protein n=1 Tax=Chitinophaga oryziterrae TaxID=1031224 RepID=A0A6N8JG81_9BACT|nr:hypothetical protein [Chitinophaga oryziterrae]MVT44217.1 hypothetical protein [Chitinophaga oryziterrae]
MELDHYIESGIIESYALGLATASEIEELQHMRKLYPELNTEIRMVERRMEMVALTEGVQPPSKLKDRIFQRINWDEEKDTKEKDKSNYTFINIQSRNQDYITVHKWWKLFFIMVFIVSKVCLFAAIYYYLKYQQSQEKSAQSSSQTEYRIPTK